MPAIFLRLSLEGTMKKVLIGMAFLTLNLAIFAASTEFGYPVEGEPWYFIKASFTDVTSLSKGAWRVSRVTINGTRTRDFLLYQGGSEVLGMDIRGQLPFEIKARFSWQAHQACEIQVQLENLKTRKTETLSQKVSSPDLKGYWDPAWKNYMALVIAEENGIERHNYPVHATIGIFADYLRSGDEIRVVKAERAGDDVAYTDIPSQVYDLVTWSDAKFLAAKVTDKIIGQPFLRYHPTTSFSLAFLANLKPREKATYLVFYNNPAAPEPTYATDLKVIGAGAGQPIGKTIENNFYKAILNKKSGVIYEITEKSSKTLFEHKLETNGSIHWNPCLYSPPHSWTHTSDWENPPYVEANGPIFYSIRMAAPLPFYPQALCSVTYHFYANLPYILVQTTIDITADMFVQALRNGEIVFNKKVFKNVGYETMDGRVETIDLLHTRMHPDHVVTLRPDTPWVTFYNQDKGVAFANLFLDLAMTNVEGGEASTEQPFIYIQNGPWYYLARGLVYSFGTNNQIRMLPVRKGSVYSERLAFYPFSFKKDQGYSAGVDTLFRMLKYPLSVMESIETYAESPEGWVTPILTEPFEEGVERAIGGKKKNEY
jgi:hypothetical protein